MKNISVIALVATVVLVSRGVVNAQNLATVSVNVSSLGKVIPTDFDGFSIEVDDTANKYLGIASQPNTVFYQLLKNLGSATIRIGGSSTDYSCWNPSTAPNPKKCSFTITQDGLNGYMKGSANTGWGILLGINLQQNSGSWADEYGVAAVQANAAYPGSKLLGFEIGNEPDLYISSLSALETDWQGYISAFKGNSTTAPVALVGPAYDDASDIWRNSYFAPWMDAVGPSNLGFTTLHEYPLDVCNGRDAKQVTIPNLLAQSLMTGYENMVTTNNWAGNANSRGLQLELGESNSAACGGKKGVSDVMAATLWGLDWLFVNFNLGFSRINFHMDSAAYSAVQVSTSTGSNGTITYTNTVEALYYGMYGFSKNAVGKAILPTTVTSSNNVKAYAVRASSTSPVLVFVLNKDLSASGTVTVTPSVAMTSASLLLVQGTSLSATSSGITYGGLQFNNSTGSLNGTPQTSTISPVSGSYSFTLPNAAYAILTINP